MPRKLDMATLEAAARYHAGLFMLNSGRRDADFVIGQFHDFMYLDEQLALIDLTRDQLGKGARDDFDARIAKLATDKPRDPAVFEKLLAARLAITPDGEHIEGKIGSSKVDSRPIGRHDIEIEAPESVAYRRRMRAMGLAPGPRRTIMKNVKLQWPIYAGEGDERIRAGGGAADPLPEGTPGLPVGALVFNMSAGLAVLALDGMLNGLDAGTSNAIIECRDGTQPLDPDDATVGTLGASLAMTDPAFPTAVDQSDGTVRATASTVFDDVSADATITITYCRVSSTNDGITPLDDLLDGSAGVGTFDFNWNTVAFVSGATVSITAYTVDLDQGATAT
jgi:hypothetical protein